MASQKFPEYQLVDGFILPGGFDPEAYRSTIKYKPKDDDMFLTTYPKCGTTWMQYLTYLIYHDGQPPTDMFEFNRHVPFFELTGIEAIETRLRPGVIKTHLPFTVEPYSPKAKYIYVARNPKDCCVSFYHHTKMNPIYNFEDGEFDVFFELFLKGEVDYGDYFDSFLSWYEHRNDPNILFVLFEDMKHKPKESIYKVASFLGDQYKKKMDEDPSYIDKILFLSSSDEMKKAVKPVSVICLQDGFDLTKVSSGLRYMVNYIKGRDKKSSENTFTLVRKGVTGGWRETFTEDQNRRLDKRIEEKIGGTEVFRYWKDGGYI